MAATQRKHWRDIKKKKIDAQTDGQNYSGKTRNIRLFLGRI